MRSDMSLKSNNFVSGIRLRLWHPFLLMQQSVVSERHALFFKIAGLALVYFLTAKFGLSLADSTEQVTTIWPPTGIALASLLIFGYRVWPGIFLGAFVANLTAQEPVLTALGIGITNTTTGILGAHFLRGTGFKNNLSRLRDILSLVFVGGFLSTLVSSTFGALNLSLSGIISWAEFGRVWLTWWLGDSMGVLIVAPIILAYSNKRAIGFLKSKDWEAVLFFGLLILTASYLFLGPTLNNSPIAYMILPFTVWAALRMRPIGAATTNFIVAAIVLVGTILGRGPFKQFEAMETNVLFALSYVFVNTTTSLLMAAAIEERRRTEEEKLHQLYHDLLTGLPNRFYFFEEVNQILEGAQDTGDTFALLKLDLDRFKTINDSLGYGAGDYLLKLIVKRLKKELFPIELFARMDGDEFIVFLKETKNDERAVSVANKILGSLKDPFLLNGQEVSVTTSIGISSFPMDASDASGLLNTAKSALHLAKKLGRNNYQFYSKSLTMTTFQELTLENALRRALKNNELKLYYQPQIDLNTGQIIKNEALLRWEHPSMGLLKPSEFIELAEVTGLIEDIGEFALETAIARTAAWHQAGLNVGVAVNISSRQFHQKALPKKVRFFLEKYSLPAKYLELELTERTLLADAQLVRKCMEELKKIGTTFSIDDFNTGYSSMTYIQHFPIDVIKIGKEFIKGIPQDQKDTAIAKSIIGLAHSLDKPVTAEGVETKLQLDFLVQQKCDRVQGYYFSKPMDEERCFQLMEKRPNYKFHYIQESNHVLNFPS